MPLLGAACTVLVDNILDTDVWLHPAQSTQADM